MIEKQEKPKIYKKRCPYCDKEISSLSKNQFDFNFFSHTGACKQKIMKQANKDAKAKSIQNSTHPDSFFVHTNPDRVVQDQKEKSK